VTTSRRRLPVFRHTGVRLEIGRSGSAASAHPTRPSSGSYDYRGRLPAGTSGSSRDRGARRRDSRSPTELNIYTRLCRFGTYAQ
jgi:hypothetical protein